MSPHSVLFVLHPFYSAYSLTFCSSDTNTPPHFLSNFLFSPLQGQLKTSCGQFRSQFVNWHQACKHTSALEFIKGRVSLESKPQHITRNTLSPHSLPGTSHQDKIDTLILLRKERKQKKEKERKEKQTAYWPYSSWWKLTWRLSVMMTVMITNRPTYGSKGSLCTSAQWRQPVQNEPVYEA